MLTFFARFFGADAEARAHLNSIAHVAVEFEKADAAIYAAERKFKKVRETKISDFRNLKKRTFERTRDAIARLGIKIDEEETRVDESYATAKDKIFGKRQTVKRLASRVEGSDFDFDC